MKGSIKFVVAIAPFFVIAWAGFQLGNNEELVVNHPWSALFAFVTTVVLSALGAAFIIAALDKKKPPTTYRRRH